MKPRFQLLAAFAGVLVSLTGTANVMAAPQSSFYLAVSNPQSDSNMRWAQRRTEENIDMLQHDQHDYNGYRAARHYALPAGSRTDRARLAVR